jgi:putative endopeptidase
MRSSLLIASAMAVAFAAPSLDAKSKPTPVAAAPVKPLAPRYGAWGVDLANRDASVTPGEDFNRYANGTWLARATIPADQTKSSSMRDIYNLTLEQKKYIIASQGPETQIGGLYKSFMDEKAVEKVSDKPLRAELAKIAAIPDKAAMARYMGATAGSFGRSLIDTGIIPDLDDSSTKIFWLGQGGIGLPDRDYYLKDEFKPQRDAYLAYIQRQLALAGYKDPAGTAATVLAFETEVAKLSWERAERRQLDKLNNPTTLAKLKTDVPGLDWAAFFDGLGITQPGKINSSEKSAIERLAKLFGDTPLETLKAWESFAVTDQASPYLPDRYVQSRFQYTKVLSGLDQLPPRWKRADTLLDGTLGELIGKVYVDDFFPARSKAMMEELVANLKVAMASRIAGNDWMEPATKMSALEKLAKMKVMVGYPETFRDYSALKIDANDLYGNVVRSSGFEWQYQLSQLYKPVDRNKWSMNPQEVNAYNGSLENKIVFPAGILQAPIFDPDADPAVNYGSAGAVIGHEISHGFDDQGRKIDATGSLRDWWTAKDAERFAAEAAKYGAQFDSYEPIPGVHVNGKVTMGENVADLAGLLIAYEAYHASLKGKPAPVIDGLTGDQRFFLAFAQTWREKLRPEAAKQQIASDPHTPSEFRVIGPLRNVDAWYDAFGIKAGGGKYALAPEARVHIW